MVKFVCEECHYKFEGKIENVPRKCPYCGKEGIVKEPNAQDLIDG
ncbi:MAG: rubredoxin [Candidatus Pacearchaeota archaeon]|jgi:DNA-directed RNA polymerase subunit RPC12/RpoP